MLEIFKAILLVVNLVLTLVILFAVVTYVVTKREMEVESVTYTTTILWGLFYYLS